MPEELQVTVEILLPSGMLHIYTVHDMNYVQKRYDGYTEMESIRLFFGELKEQLVANVKKFACLTRISSEPRSRTYIVKFDTDNKREALKWFGQQAAEGTFLIDENGDITASIVSPEEAAAIEAANAEE